LLGVDSGPETFSAVTLRPSAKANAVGFNDGDAAGQVVRQALDCGQDRSVHLVRRHLIGQPRHDDAPVVVRREPDLVSEAQVAGDDREAFANCILHHGFVRLGAQADVADVTGLPPEVRQDTSQAARKVLVDQKARQASHSPDLLIGYQLGRIREGRQNVFPSDAILLGDIFDLHPACNLADQHIHGDPGPRDDGPSEAYFGIDGNPRCNLPHACILPRDGHRRIDQRGHREERRCLHKVDATAADKGGPVSVSSRPFSGSPKPRQGGSITVPPDVLFGPEGLSKALPPWAVRPRGLRDGRGTRERRQRKPPFASAIQIMAIMIRYV